VRRFTIFGLKPPRLLALGGLVLVGFFYWKPATSYLHTKRELQQRQTQVRALRAEKARLEARIAQAGTGQELVREARRLDLVKPGERLFIVKGIPAWRQAHRAH
jgi:cell division protein FtsB